MRRWSRPLILLLALLLPTFATHGQSSSEAPYLYYYSDRLNAFVVERADGTDSRVFGSGLMMRIPGTLPWITGQGWSPSGQWFAWAIANYGAFGSEDDYAQAFAVKVDGSLHLPIPHGMKHVQMNWSPEADQLMVVGDTYEKLDADPKSDHHEGYEHIDFYLFDASTSRTLLTEQLTWYSTSDPSLRTPQIQWLDSTHVQVDYESLPMTPDGSSLQGYRASFDLKGLMRNEQLAMPPVLGLERAFKFPDDRTVISPDGQFTALISDGIVIHHLQAGTDNISRPAARSYQASTDGTVLWHRGSRWLLDVRDGLVAGGGSCCYHIGVANVYGTVRRDLTEVLDMTPVSANWLPQRVNPSYLTKLIPSLTTDHLINRVLHGTEWPFDLSWSPDGKQIVGWGNDYGGRGVTAWRILSGETRLLYKQLSDGKIPVWRTNGDGQYVIQLADTPDPANKIPNGVFIVAESADKQLGVIVVGAENSLDIIALHTGIILHKMEQNDLGIPVAKFSADGKMLVVTGPFTQNVKILDTRTWNTIAAIDHPATAIAFSPDGKQIAVNAAWDVEIYNVADLIQFAAKR